MDEKLIDDAFYVKQKKYGLWDSYDKDGKGIVTSLTEESCVETQDLFYNLDKKIA